MYEVYVLVERKKGMLANLLMLVVVFCTIFSTLATIFIMPMFFSVAILFAALLWVIERRNVEFEYSYFDGELRFTKIINKSKRKSIKTYSMDEVQVIAPAGDRSVYNYENNSRIGVKNLTSGNSGAAVYSLVVKEAEGLSLIKFEPDEKFLEAICVKYGQKVKR